MLVGLICPAGIGDRAWVDRGIGLANVARRGGWCNSVSWRSGRTANGGHSHKRQGDQQASNG